MIKNKFSYLTITLLSIFFLLIGNDCYTSSVKNNKIINITILATSDIHGNIYPWDYNTAKSADVGLAKVYTIVKDVRAKNPYTLLVDNGDLIQGTPLVSYYNALLAKNNFVHPMIDVMNYMNYDSMTLGNHEFNFGLDILSKVINAAKFPILSANIYKKDGSNFVKPYIIKNINNVKVGILGLTTKTIPEWENVDNYKGLTFNDLVQEGKKWVNILKNKEKVDIVVVVAHSGLEESSDTIPENQIIAIVENVPFIDVIVAGHRHANIPEKRINNVIVTEPGKWGEYVSRIDITLTNNNGKYKITKVSSNTISTKGIEAAEEILKLADTYHKTTLEYVNTKIGVALGDFIPAEELPEELLNSNISILQLIDTPLIDLVNNIQLYYGNADVSMAAMFNKDGNIKKGDITIRDIYGLYIFENYLYTIEITGKQLKELMEWSARFFNQFKPGDKVITKNKDIKDYNYDMFQGVNYMIDLSMPEGQRIGNLYFKGKPVTDNMILKLALNNYRLNGGGGYMKAAGITNPKILYDSQKTLGDNGQIRNLIINYIKEKVTIAPEVDNNWKILIPSLVH